MGVETVKEKSLMLWEVLSGIEAQGGYSAARTDLYKWMDFTEEGEEKKVS